MSRREDVETDIWVDADFLALAPQAKLTYLWSFTNAHGNMAGLYKAAPRTIAFETGMTDEAVSGAVDELQAARFLKVDGCVLWVRSRIRHLRTRTPQIAVSIARDLDRLHPHPFVGELLAEYQHHSWLLDIVRERTNLLSSPHKGFREVHGNLIEVAGQGQGLKDVGEVRRKGNRSRRASADLGKRRPLPAPSCPGIDPEAQLEWEAAAAQVCAANPLADVWLTDAHAHFIHAGVLAIGAPIEKASWLRSRVGQALNDAAGRRVDIYPCSQQANQEAA